MQPRRFSPVRTPNARAILVREVWWHLEAARQDGARRGQGLKSNSQQDLQPDRGAHNRLPPRSIDRRWGSLKMPECDYRRMVSVSDFLHEPIEARYDSKLQGAKVILSTGPNAR